MPTTIELSILQPSTLVEIIDSSLDIFCDSCGDAEDMADLEPLQQHLTNAVAAWCSYRDAMGDCPQTVAMGERIAAAFQQAAAKIIDLAQLP